MRIDYDINDDSILLDAYATNLNYSYLSSGSLTGLLPSDKSLTHRLILLSSMIKKSCTVLNPLISYDTISTYNALVSIGVRSLIQLVKEDGKIQNISDGLSWIDPDSLIKAVENKGEKEKIRIITDGCIYDLDRGVNKELVKIDCMGSGTTTRLFMGVISSCKGRRVLIDGNSSLRKRPMEKVVGLLEKLGATIYPSDFSTDRNHLPLIVEGVNLSSQDEIHIDLGSAQLKSAVIFSLLNTPSNFKISLPSGSRRVTEKIVEDLFLKNNAGEIRSRYNSGIETITINQTRKISDFSSFTKSVPADPSSLSYIVALICILDPSFKMEFNSLLYERDRFSWVEVLNRMGFSLKLKEDPINKRLILSISERSEDKLKLYPIELTSDQVPSLIDELPLIMGLSMFVDGVSNFYGVEALRGKESDRIEGVKRLADLFGVECRIKRSGSRVDVSVRGEGSNLDRLRVLDPDRIYDASADHRLVMTACVCGICSKSQFKIKTISSVKESFPSFFSVVSRIVN